MQILKVSIVVPCYNVDKYLDRCLNSIVNQTLREVEIILVDDKSPGIVPVMCDEWAKRDSRIKVVHKDCNEGLGFARNSGLEVANGEYVAFVDSDDFVELNMYERLYSEAKCSDADVVFSNFFTEGQSGVWHVSNEVRGRKEWDNDSINDFVLDMIASRPTDNFERKYQMSVWHSIYRKSIIDENIIRFHSEREVCSEDFPFQIDFLLKAKKIVFLPDAFYHYCCNELSLTSTFNPDKFRRIRNLYELMCLQLKSVEDSQLRLDKFYIGYVRNRICELILSNVDNKDLYLQNVMMDEKLLTIKNRFPIASLPIYPRLFSYLLFNRKKSLLKLFVYVQAYIKKISGKRV